MAVWRTKLAKRLLQSSKNRTCIAGQPGAKILGPIKGAALLKKVDATHNLGHVIARAHYIKRELGICSLAFVWCRNNRGKGVFLARGKRL